MLAASHVSQGTEIGIAKTIDTLNDILKNSEKMHAKDYLMSYEENGQRHYVSIMTSCNYYMIAFNYRTNSMLVIHETDETGNGFYKAFGEKYSYGMMKSSRSEE